MYTQGPNPQSLLGSRVRGNDEWEGWFAWSGFRQLSWTRQARHVIDAAFNQSQMRAL